MLKLDNVKCIIWDLDGTLIDSFKAFKKVTAEIFVELNLPLPDDETFLKNYHGSLERTIEALTGLDDDLLHDKLLDMFLLKQVDYYDKNDAGFFSDALELARQAGQKGLKQFVLTNRDHNGRHSASPRSIIARSVIAEYIHDIHCGDEVEFRKPDVRSLGTWLDQHGLSAEQVLIVGDQFVDAKLADNLGCRAVLAQRSEPIPHLEEFAGNPSLFIVKSLDQIELD
ncbi:MAG TPA: HAD hydrolase-like protein [Candidatus Saccharimonadales bacterium]|nr:HAD hydrolase-like protein [Candidatus Saccharimonadales bacterium]